MAAPSLTDIDALFQAKIDQYVPTLQKHVWTINPYQSLIPRATFNPMLGLTPMVITSTAESLTSYPTAMTQVVLNDGTGDASVTPSLLRTGSKRRTYTIYAAEYCSQAVQLSDLQFEFQMDQQMAAYEEFMNNTSSTFMADYARYQLTGMIDRKVSITGTGGADYDVDENTDIWTTGLNPLDAPTQRLNWGHLQTFYDYLASFGATIYAPARAAGEAIFPLTVGPGMKRKLFQDDEQVHSTVDWGPNPYGNFQARGISQAVNGFLPNVDELIPRFKDDGSGGYTEIYPLINQATTGTGQKGYESVPNPAYQPTNVAGGEAVYEAFYITTPELCEIQPRPSPGTSYSMATFDVQNYSGDLTWLNIQTDTNPHRDRGYYKFRFHLATMPRKTKMGIMGLFKINP